MNTILKSDRETYEAARALLPSTYGEDTTEQVYDILSAKGVDYDGALFNKVPGVRAAVCVLSGGPYCEDSLQGFITSYEAARDIKPVISWITEEGEFMTLTKIDTTLGMPEIGAQLPAAFEALAAELGVEVHTGPSL